MVRSLFKLQSNGYKIETKFEVDERFQTRFIAKKNAPKGELCRSFIASYFLHTGRKNGFA